jgi:transcriptional regulator with XRE-family HTH domain
MFGDQIKSIRMEMNISQNELAKKAQVSRSTLSNIETRNIMPKYDTAVSLIQALHITPEFFNNFKRQENKLTPSIEDRFMRLASMAESEIINDLKMDIRRQLKLGNDDILTGILSVLESNDLFAHNQIEDARILANQVWDNLKNRDFYTPVDIFLINNILCLFDLETTNNMVKLLKFQITSYFPELKSMLIASSLNLGFNYMLAGEFGEAKQIFEETLPFAIELHRVDFIAVIKFRLSFIENGYSNDLIQIMDSLELYGHEKYRKIFEDELIELGYEG